MSTKLRDNACAMSILSKGSRRGTGAGDFVHGDGQLAEALVDDGSGYIWRDRAGAGKLAEAVLGGDFPSGRGADQHLIVVLVFNGSPSGLS